MKTYKFEITPLNEKYALITSIFLDGVCIWNDKFTANTLQEIQNLVNVYLQEY